MTTPTALPDSVLAGFATYFRPLEDPRMTSKTHHPLLNVLLIAVLGVLCGAEGWEDLADFGVAKRDFLATFLDLPHGVPRKDTFRRVFEALAPGAFGRCFQRWTGALVGTLALLGKHVALDGKTLRAALAHRDTPALHLVHAWVVDNDALFGQVAGVGKGQELGALPDLLRLLDLRGATVTIDALGCQPDIAAQIVDAGAAYILCVKDNQPTLHREAAQCLAAAQAAAGPDLTPRHARTEEHGHGRHEVREAWVVDDLTACPTAARWAGAASLILIERTRIRGDVTEQTSHCYISNLTDLDATTGLTRVRRHWSVENTLHWTLDVAFREDQCRIHDARGAENFALLRRMALHAFKRDKANKRGIRSKQKKCGWSDSYLLSILQLMNPPTGDTVT